jgi:hypothetical protein
VAYAEELIASELKMASAFFFERRSVSSASDASGWPMRTRLIVAHVRSRAVSGALAAGRAVSWPAPLYRK